MKRPTISYTATLIALLSLGATFVAAEPFSLISETTWGGAGSDIAEAVATGPDGSTYVAGRTGSFDTDLSLSVFVLKFAPDGSLLWQRTWDIPGGFGDQEPTDAAVASDGSVYVVGRTFGVGGDALLLKFDSDGNLAWQRTWGGSGHEIAEGVAVAADGSVYVAGSTERTFSEDPDAFLLKLAPDATIIWQKTYGTAGASEGASDIVVAADGSIFIAGGTPIPGAFGFHIVKLTPDGSIIWQRSYTAGSGVDPRGGLASGPDGSVVVAGAFFDLDFGLDAAVVKFDGDGNLVFDRAWGGRDGDDGESVVIGSDGTIFLAGSTASFGIAPDDAFLVKILSNGRGKEAVTWGGTGLDKGHDVAVAPDGTIVLSGTAEAPPYSFLRAPTKVARLRGTVGVPAGMMTDVTTGFVDPVGVVVIVNGSLTYAGGFDAALLKILP